MNYELYCDKNAVNNKEQKLVIVPPNMNIMNSFIHSIQERIFDLRFRHLLNTNNSKCNFCTVIFVHIEKNLNLNSKCNAHIASEYYMNS